MFVDHCFLLRAMSLGVRPPIICPCVRVLHHHKRWEIHLVLVTRVIISLIQGQHLGWIDMVKLDLGFPIPYGLWPLAVREVSGLYLRFAMSWVSCVGREFAIQDVMILD